MMCYYENYVGYSFLLSGSSMDVYSGRYGWVQGKHSLIYDVHMAAAIVGDRVCL